MLVTYQVYDDDTRVGGGSANLKLVQLEDGLNIVSTIRFTASFKLTVTRIEIAVGNRVWVEPCEPTLMGMGDTFVWDFKMHCTDTK